MKVYGATTDSAPEPTRRKVGIAEYEVTDGEAVITTSGLGSCLGVALRDADAGVAGLIHVMLPRAEDSTSTNPAKFADTGIDEMLAEMRAAGADPGNVTAKIAGGSDMLEFSESEGGSIGQRNIAATRDRLADHGIEVVAADVGGDYGRSLEFDTESGDLDIKSANAGNQTL